jgi:hypothetical protein
MFPIGNIGLSPLLCGDIISGIEKRGIPFVGKENPLFMLRKRENT